MIELRCVRCGNLPNKSNRCGGAHLVYVVMDKRKPVPDKELVEAMEIVKPVADLLGISESETLLALKYLTNTGVSVAHAACSLRKVMWELKRENENF